MVGKIGLGGGCHWCTESYFLALRGVTKVEQGWIAAEEPNTDFSEAIIVHYDDELIPLDILIAVHLHTHASTSMHSFRKKYRSAVYVFNAEVQKVQASIDKNQVDFENKIITKALSFKAFKPNIDKYLNYYSKNKDNQFCERYINPKLEEINKKFTDYYKL